MLFLLKDGDTMDQVIYMQIGKRINSNKFYDFMDSYDLTYGELLGIIDYGIHSNISSLQISSLNKLLREKQCVFRLTDSKIGIIADTHIGSPFMNWDYIYQAYDSFYDQGVKTVLHLGDLFHGPSYKNRNNQNKAILQCYQQLVDFEEHYPKGFDNFFIHGNHDEKFLKIGINLWQQLATKREDFFSLGKGKCYISIGDFVLSLNDPIASSVCLPPNMNCDFSLYAHYHYFKKYKGKIYIGTCSNILNRDFSPGINNPGFAILRINSNHLRMKVYDLSINSKKKMLSFSYYKQTKR